MQSLVFRSNSWDKKYLDVTKAFAAGQIFMPRFSAELVEHFRSPRNAGEMADATVIGSAARGGNAPRVAVYLKVDNDLVTRASFTTFGCGVTIACCSAVTELATGRTVAECAEITEQSVVEALRGIPADKKFCAGLVVSALHDAIAKLAWDRR